MRVRGCEQVKADTFEDTAEWDPVGGAKNAKEDIQKILVPFNIHHVSPASTRNKVCVLLRRPPNNTRVL